MSDEESPVVDQSIQIGRDATGNIMISGRGNVIVIESTRFQAAEAPTPPRAADIGPNPYMGLLAFHETDAARFFGRKEQTARLWERLRDLHSHVSGERPTRLLPVLGPSGSGKSSLARAGLIAELARRPLPGMRRARVGVMTPGAHPVEALAAVLARVATNDSTPVAKTTEFEAALKRPNDDGECDGLRRIADALPDIAGAPLIVLVDQFEEIYSLCTDKSERTLFIDNVLLAARDAGGHLSVVITLRTDFVGETQTHEALNAVICEHQVMIPAMNEQGLRQAIAKPAELAGHPLDDAMVALLLSDTRGRDGALPLLQFALARIWDGMADGVGPAVTYRAIGGVGGALAGEARRIYRSLSNEEKKIAKRVFLGLVQLGEGTRDTRRRAKVKSLIGVADDPKHVEGVIRRFSAPDVRLITLSADERGGADSAEITHEALFDHWRQLSNWVEVSREDVRFKRRLDTVVANWNDQGRPEGGLWRPPDLNLLTQFYARATEDMTPLQMRFLVESSRAEKQRLENAQREKRQLRHRTAIATGAAIMAFLLLVVSIILSVVALGLAKKEPLPGELAHGGGEIDAPGDQVIEKEPLPSEPARGASEIDAPGDQVIEKEPLPGEPARGGGEIDAPGDQAIEKEPLPGELAHGGAEIDPLGNQSSEKEPLPSEPAHGGGEIDVLVAQSIERGRRSSELARSGRENEALVIAVQAVGPLLLDKRDLPPAAYQGLFAAVTATGESIIVRGHTARVVDASFSPDGAHVVTASDDHTARLWDAQTGDELAVLEGHSGPVRTASFSPDGAQVITASYDRTARLWDARTGKELVVLEGDGKVVFASFNPDGVRVVTATNVRTARLWDSRTGLELAVHEDRVLHGHSSLDFSASFSPDGAQVVTASIDKTARLWDANTGKEFAVLEGHVGAISSASFSPDGTQVVTASMDSQARLWDARTGQLRGVLAGGGGAVQSAAFSPDSAYVVTASGPTASVWDARTGKILFVLRGRGMVRGASFGPDGTRVLAVKGGPAVLWDVQTGEMLAVFEGGVNASASFSPDGAHVVTVSGDDTARLWLVGTPELLRRACELLGDRVDSEGLRKYCDIGN